MVSAKTYLTGGIGSRHDGRGVRRPLRAAARPRLLRDLRGDRVDHVELAPASAHRRGALRRADGAHALQRLPRRPRPRRHELLLRQSRCSRASRRTARLVRLRLLPAQRHAAAGEPRALHGDAHRRRRAAPPVHARPAQRRAGLRARDRDRLPVRRRRRDAGGRRAGRRPASCRCASRAGPTRRRCTVNGQPSTPNPARRLPALRARVVRPATRSCSSCRFARGPSTRPTRSTRCAAVSRSSAARSSTASKASTCRPRVDLGAVSVDASTARRPSEPGLDISGPPGRSRSASRAADDDPPPDGLALPRPPGSHRRGDRASPSPGRPLELRATPYYSWGNRGATSMRVWTATPEGRESHTRKPPEHHLRHGARASGPRSNEGRRHGRERQGRPGDRPSSCSEQRPRGAQRRPVALGRVEHPGLAGAVPGRRPDRLRPDARGAQRRGAPAGDPGRRPPRRDPLPGPRHPGRRLSHQYHVDLHGLRRRGAVAARTRRVGLERDDARASVRRVRPTTRRSTRGTNSAPSPPTPSRRCSARRWRGSSAAGAASPSSACASRTSWSGPTTSRFPSFWGDPQLRRWNLWSYVDESHVGQSTRRALEAEVRGADTFIIAAADTVMQRPSAELMAEVYPGRSRARTLGEHETLLVDRQGARRARLQARLQLARCSSELQGFPAGPSARPAFDVSDARIRRMGHRRHRLGRRRRLRNR